MSDSKIKMNKQLNKEPTYIDLFCGIGSFHHSFKKHKFKCVLACDLSKPARDTYKRNYGIEPLGDITKIKPKDVSPYDILCAGFPCQPFSQAGKHKGFKDERGNMFLQIMKFVKCHKPKLVVLENVQGLLNHDGGNTFKTIETLLNKNKYTMVYKVLKCSDYGIPQMRKRLFIIGVHQKILKKDYKDLLDFDKYKKSTTLSKFLKKKFEKDTAYTIRCGGKNSPINGRHNWDGYIVDGKEYRLTIEDALKLQGFNKNFVLEGSTTEKWRLLGNTIPTVFTGMIAESIRSYLSI